jgi:hypothetical protein
MRYPRGGTMSGRGKTTLPRRGRTSTRSVTSLAGTPTTLPSSDQPFACADPAYLREVSAHSSGRCLEGGVSGCALRYCSPRITYPRSYGALTPCARTASKNPSQNFGSGPGAAQVCTHSHTSWLARADRLLYTLTQAMLSGSNAIGGFCLAHYFCILSNQRLGRTPTRHANAPKHR